MEPPRLIVRLLDLDFGLNGCAEKISGRSARPPPEETKAA
jgi:hypothetical protein